MVSKIAADEAKLAAKIEKHPIQWVALGFLLGFLVGGIVKWLL